MDGQERRRLDERLRRSAEDSRRDAIRRAHARNQILDLKNKAIRTITERRKLEGVSAGNGTKEKGGSAKLGLVGAVFGLAAYLLKKR